MSQITFFPRYSPTFGQKPAAGERYGMEAHEILNDFMKGDDIRDDPNPAENDVCTQGAVGTKESAKC